MREYTFVLRYAFQSPRSGQICSNKMFLTYDNLVGLALFQSPRSGQICSNEASVARIFLAASIRFQSPRSGQICSNYPGSIQSSGKFGFQSPRSGQICSNSLKCYFRKIKINKFI